MASKYFLLLLPALISARIEIDISAGSESERDVRISGYAVDVISDPERFTFGLNEEDLKRSVQAFFGKRPTSVFVKSPTPWGDLYKSYNWAQVTRTLTPQRAQILSMNSQPTIVLTQIFHNNSTKTAEFKAEISQKVENTVSSSWTKDGDLTIGQDIVYGVDFKVASASETTSYKYSSKWGEGTTKTKTVTVGSTSGVRISLEPNQTVIAKLHANRGTMKVKVDYEASLSGTVAVNYDETYKGHHFWSMNVHSVMKAGSLLRRSVQSSEIITIGYFSDSRVIIEDSETNALLYSIPMNLY